MERLIKKMKHVVFKCKNYNPEEKTELFLHHCPKKSSPFLLHNWENEQPNQRSSLLHKALVKSERMCKLPHWKPITRWRSPNNLKTITTVRGRKGKLQPLWDHWGKSVGKPDLWERHLGVSICRWPRSTGLPGQATAAECVAPPMHFPCTYRNFRGDLTEVSSVGDLLSIGIKVHNIEDQPALSWISFFKCYYCLWL